MEYLKGLEDSSFDELKKQAEAHSVAADRKFDEASLNWLTMEVTRRFVGSFRKEKRQSSGIKEVVEEEKVDVDDRRRKEHCKNEPLVGIRQQEDEDEARVSKRQKENENEKKKKTGGQCSRTEEEPEEEKVRQKEHCKNRSLVDIGQQEEEARVSKRQKEEKKKNLVGQFSETPEEEKVADLRRRKEHCKNESLADTRQQEEEDEARVSNRQIVKKKASCVKIKNDDLQPAPDLPAEFARRIKDLNGCNPILVMQKLLTKTDVSTTHTRLTIPRTQIRNEFLLQEERSQMKNGMDVRLIEPCLAVRKMQLTKWEMNSSSIYVIRSNWMEVISNAANGLVVDNGKKTARVQLWAFRAGSKRDLCFALVNLGTMSLGEGSGNGTTTTTTTTSPSSSSDGGNEGNGESLNTGTS